MTIAANAEINFVASCIASSDAPPGLLNHHSTAEDWGNHPPLIYHSTETISQVNPPKKTGFQSRYAKPIAAMTLRELRERVQMALTRGATFTAENFSIPEAATCAKLLDVWTCNEYRWIKGHRTSKVISENDRMEIEKSEAAQFNNWQVSEDYSDLDELSKFSLDQVLDDFYDKAECTLSESAQDKPSGEPSNEGQLVKQHDKTSFSTFPPEPSGPSFLSFSSTQDSGVVMEYDYAHEAVMKTPNTYNLEPETQAYDLMDGILGIGTEHYGQYCNDYPPIQHQPFVYNASGAEVTGSLSSTPRNHIQDLPHTALPNFSGVRHELTPVKPHQVPEKNTASLENKVTYLGGGDFSSFEDMDILINTSAPENAQQPLGMGDEKRPCSIIGKSTITNASANTTNPEFKYDATINAPQGNVPSHDYNDAVDHMTAAGSQLLTDLRVHANSPTLTETVQHVAREPKTPQGSDSSSDILATSPPLVITPRPKGELKRKASAETLKLTPEYDSDSHTEGGADVDDLKSPSSFATKHGKKGLERYLEQVSGPCHTGQIIPAASPLSLQSTPLNPTTKSATNEGKTRHRFITPAPPSSPIHYGFATPAAASNLRLSENVSPSPAPRGRAAGVISPCTSASSSSHISGVVTRSRASHPSLSQTKIPLIGTPPTKKQKK